MANSPQPDSDLVPREPETEKGRLTRSQYLTFAQTALKEDELDYLSLYQKYAIAPHAAQALDQSVAALALKSGTSPRQVIQLLAQGVFTQQQIRSLSPEEKQAELPFSKPVQSPLSDEMRSIPIEELAQAFITFNAYAGTYTIDGNTVTHHLEIASIPNRIGTALMRTFTIAGNQITLRTPGNNSQTAFELIWERIMS